MIKKQSETTRSIQEKKKVRPRLFAFKVVRHVAFPKILPIILGDEGAAGRERWKERKAGVFSKAMT